MTQARPQPSSGADPVQVDPEHYSVVLENDQVRVLRITYPPGEKSVMHSHPASVGVMLTDNRTAMTLRDGSIQEMTYKAGEVNFTPAGEHLPQNIGDRALELILVELKSTRS